MAYSHFVFRVSILTFVSVLAGVHPAAVERARAETCFAADNDGAYDQDGAVNGVIRITDASTSSVPAAATPYECGALDFVIQSGGVLSLEGDEVTGAIAALVVGDLSLESGGVITADGNGCRTEYVGFTAGPSEVPDASNVCTTGVAGAATKGNDGGGGGGGGHGGTGGDGGIGARALTYGSATDPLRFGATGGGTNGAGGGAGGANGGPGAGSQFGPAQRFSGAGGGGSIGMYTKHLVEQHFPA
jgi:hypothetical protein